MDAFEDTKKSRFAAVKILLRRIINRNKKNGAYIKHR